MRLPWWTIVTRKLIVESVDMTDWHMVVETFPERPPQLSEVHARAQRPAGTEPLHDDASARSCGARPVHLRGSRHAVEHRRPQPRRDAVPERRRQRLSRRRVVLERHDQDPELRAVPRRHAVRASSSTTARCTFDRIDLTSDGRGLGHRRRGRSGALAGADLPRQVAASTSRRRRTSSSTAIASAPPARGTSRARSIFQGRPRAEGHVHQPDGRRERLALSEPARRRCSGCPTGSRSPTRRASSTAARPASTTGWRRSASKACRRCATLGRAVPRRRSLAADRLSRDARACASPAARPARNRLDWPLGKWAVKRGDGDVDVDAAARRRDR